MASFKTDESFLEKISIGNWNTTSFFLYYSDRDTSL